MSELLELSREEYAEADKLDRLPKRLLDGGWRFCNCEWDGMLIREDWKEAEYCHCIAVPEGEEPNEQEKR